MESGSGPDHQVFYPGGGVQPLSPDCASGAPINRAESSMEGKPIRPAG